MEVNEPRMDNEINVEAKKVVELILKDIIEINKDEEDDITFEERCDTESLSNSSSE